VLILYLRSRIGGWNLAFFILENDIYFSPRRKERRKRRREEH